MLQYDGKSEAGFDGHLDRFMDCGPFILVLWDTATNPIDVT